VRYRRYYIVYLSVAASRRRAGGAGGGGGGGGGDKISAAHKTDPESRPDRAAAAAADTGRTDKSMGIMCTTLYALCINNMH